MRPGDQAEKRWGAKTGEERKAERRRKLMRAAVELYGQQGFRNVSVKSVCAFAGLSERYLYESFENGEDLLRQCFTQVTRDLFRKLDKKIDTTKGTSTIKLAAALSVYLEYIKQNPPAARLFLFDMTNISPATEALHTQNLDEFGDRLVGVLGIGHLLEERRLSPLLIKGVIGGGLHVARTWVAGHYKEDIDDVVRVFMQIYLPITGIGKIAKTTVTGS